MFKNLQLERPLAVLDLETTGTNVRTDRIVEISVLKLLPEGAADHRTHRVNPGMPIPPEATAIHGITDADVADQPALAHYAEGLIAFLDGCDFCGFNILRFDLQLLDAELARAGFSLSLKDRALVDPLQVFRAYERRDLSAAVEFYCGKKHEQAHNAAADVLATVQVLDAMLGRYTDLPRSVSGLYEHFRDPNSVDPSGHFVESAGQVRFAFGKHRGQPLDEVAKTHPDYLEWMLLGDFLADTKALVKEALDNAKPPASSPRMGQVKDPECDGPDTDRECSNSRRLHRPGKVSAFLAWLGRGFTGGRGR